jgi:hypothetical protein
MKGFNIRPAVSSNIPALCKLLHAFHEFHAAGVPDRLRSLGPYEVFDTTRLTHGLQEILNNQDACLFVAEDKGRLVGFAEVFLRQDRISQGCLMVTCKVNGGSGGEGGRSTTVQAVRTW